MILTNQNQTAMLNGLPQCSTRLASRNTSGTAAIMRFFCAQKLLSSSSLCRTGWALPKGVAGARTGTPTYPVRHHDWRHVVGFIALRDKIMTNHSKNPLKALFSIYHNRKLIAFNVPGTHALHLKQSKPTLIVKFDRMGGAA